MPSFATRIPRPPASAKLADVRLGVCAGCGALNAVYADEARGGTLWVLTPAKAIKVVEASGHDDAPCAVCMGVAGLAYPKNQELLSSAFMVGGWDAVVPDMISERGLRSLYRASLTVSQAMSAASADMGGRRRRR